MQIFGGFIANTCDRDVWMVSAAFWSKSKRCEPQPQIGGNLQQELALFYSYPDDRGTFDLRESSQSPQLNCEGTVFVGGDDYGFVNLWHNRQVSVTEK